MQPLEDLTQDNSNIDNIDNIDNIENFEEFTVQPDTDIIQDNNNFETFEATEHGVLPDLTLQDDFTETDLDVQDLDIQNNVGTDIQDVFADNEFQLEELSNPHNNLDEIDNIHSENFTDAAPEEDSSINADDSQTSVQINDAFDINQEENIGSIEDLENFELPVDMDLPNLEYDEKIKQIAKNNKTDFISFLGGGCYNKFIPAMLKVEGVECAGIASKSAKKLQGRRSSADT